MGFKTEMKAAPPATRNRDRDPAMVREAERFVAEVQNGNLEARIAVTGDESLSTNTTKGKQSPREASARKQGSQITSYIQNRWPNLKLRTVWVKKAVRDEDDDFTLYVAEKRAEHEAEVDNETAAA